MKNSFIIICGFVLLSSALFFITKNPKTDHTLTVVCTTNIITDTVKNIAKDYVHVIGLMGPGVDPHLYRAREGDVHILAQANLIFYNGLHLEGKMAHMLKNMSQYVKTIAVTDSIEPNQLLSSEVENIYDPHVWHDVSLWQHTIPLICHELIQLDPEHALEYKENAQNYLEELKKLHHYVHSKKDSLPPEQRILVTAHDAFSYFGKTYGFLVIGLQGINTDSEISMRDIQELVAFIVKNKVPAIFVESSVSQRSIKALHQAIKAQGWKVTIGSELYSDALGNEISKADSYISMIKHNIDSIVTALSNT